jgi:hypothetical protein
MYSSRTACTVVVLKSHEEFLKTSQVYSIECAAEKEQQLLCSCALAISSVPMKNCVKYCIKFSYDGTDQV